MKVLILTTSGFAPTHTEKLLSQIDYLNSFSDMKVVVKKDLSLADTEYLIMTEKYDCVYPTTVFQYSHDRQNIVSFNRVLYQIMEYHRQPYIGSELFVHMLLNDKALTNLRCGMSLPGKLLTRLLWEKRNEDAKQYISEIKFPVIVKPNTLAASLGISKSSVANSLEELFDIIQKQFTQFPNVSELLLEFYLSNACEFTVSVTGNGSKTICNTTALVSRTNSYEMFSYKNKNLEPSMRSISYTSNIPKHIKTLLINKAIYLANLLRVRDYSRFDFLMDEREQLYLIDANSLPSLGGNYFLEYIEKQFVTQSQILAIILTVFCKRMCFPYPEYINDLSNEILKMII